jgi:hypothetical protein
VQLPAYNVGASPLRDAIGEESASAGVMGVMSGEGEVFRVVMFSRAPAAAFVSEWFLYDDCFQIKTLTEEAVSAGGMEILWKR